MIERRHEFVAPKLQIQHEEMRAARSASRMLGALLVMMLFIAGGLTCAVVERWMTR